MRKAVRAFYRFSQYPETRPFRWRALRVQAGRDLAVIAWYIITSPIWLPVTIIMVITLPIAWLHDYFDREAPLQWLAVPLVPIEDWWSRACRELNPIFLDAEKRTKPTDVVG